MKATPERTGLTTYDAKDPDTKFPPIGQLRPPKGAPNVLIILIDDAGFGSSSAFGAGRLLERAAPQPRPSPLSSDRRTSWLRCPGRLRNSHFPNPNSDLPFTQNKLIWVPPNISPPGAGRAVVLSADFHVARRSRRMSRWCSDGWLCIHNGEEIMRRIMGAAVLGAAIALGMSVETGHAQDSAKPNILVIWGDDIGWFNTSAYNRGMMGYRTPNIDSVATGGMMFTDAYGQQSCTAGRSAFITGQSPLRTGLLKVGLPGASEGLSGEDPTIAELLKPLGYATGQFGKNHLGDRDEHLPTNHGFDEFLGNLYHLNAEEEPEHPDYPQDPEFKAKFGPRGVIHSYAGGKIEDTGPLTKKRMETVDAEFLAAAEDFIGRAHQANKPFFVWFNTSRMHIWTHLQKESEGKTGLGVYADGIVEHDDQVGQLLKKLDCPASAIVRQTG
jgi:arylsulfatase A-like enzyme